MNSFLCNGTNDHLGCFKFWRVLGSKTEKHLLLKKEKEVQAAVNREKGRKKL